MQNTNQTFLVFSEIFSTNLGDSAIAEGLKVSLQGKKRNYIALDFSSGAMKKNVRKSNHSHDKKNQDKKKIVQVIKKNPLIYKSINSARISSRYLINFKTVNENFKKADVVIIGGGALLQDNAMTFPTSLLAIRLFNLVHKKKLLVLGCSVGDEFSFLGKFFINFFLKNCADIYLRDPNSVNNISKNFGINAKLIPDHALRLELMTSNDKKCNNENIICGVNILNFSAHGRSSQKDFQENYTNFFDTLITQMLNNSEFQKVILFTTGDSNDKEMLEKIYNKHAKNNENKIEIYIPDTYTNLISFMSSLDVLFNSRLHASILGLVSETPTLSVIWDKKVEGFYRLSNLNNKVFTANPSNAELAVLETIKSSKEKQLYVDIKNNLVENHKRIMGNILNDKKVADYDIFS